MKTIKQLISRLIVDAGQDANAAQATHPTACNYNDDYYGDQRCEQARDTDRVETR